MRFLSYTVVLAGVLLSCYIGNSSAQELTFSTELNSNGDLPSIAETTVAGQTEEDENLTSQEIQQDNNEATVTERQPQQHVSLNFNEFVSEANNVPSSLQQEDVSDSTSTENVDTQVIGDVKKESEIFKFSEPETSSEAFETKERQWVQKIQVAKSRSLNTLNKNDTQKLSIKPIWFGKIITNVLYETTWSTHQTNPKCTNDLQIYNKHIQNFTLWAAKSKLLFIP